MELSLIKQPCLIPRACMVKLQAVYPTLKKAERNAANLMIDDPESIIRGTIVNVAKQAGCSESTWVRLSKRLGYSGFLMLKAGLNESIEAAAQADDGIAALYEDITKDTPPLTIAKRVFDSSIDALQDTFELIDAQEYDRAINALCCASKIVLCGAGDAYAVALSAYLKFFRAGLNVYANTDQDLQLIAISNMHPGDVLIAISYSGKTKSTLELVRYANERGATVLAITNFPVSTLTKQSEIVLLTAAFTKQLNGEIMSKRVTQLCLIESLYVNLLLKSSKNLDENIHAADAAIDINKY